MTAYAMERPANPLYWHTLQNLMWPYQDSTVHTNIVMILQGDVPYTLCPLVSISMLKKRRWWWHDDVLLYVKGGKNEAKLEHTKSTANGIKNKVCYPKYKWSHPLDISDSILRVLSRYKKFKLSENVPSLLLTHYSERPERPTQRHTLHTNAVKKLNWEVK